MIYSKNDSDPLCMDCFGENIMSTCSSWGCRNTVIGRVGSKCDSCNNPSKLCPGCTYNEIGESATLCDSCVDKRQRGRCTNRSCNRKIPKGEHRDQNGWCERCMAENSRERFTAGGWNFD